MASRAQKIRLVLFLISSATILLLFLFYIAGRNVLKPREIYFVEFPGSVSGLRSGDVVKYGGINVGRVEKISVSPDDLGVIVVKISVERDKIPNVIREDTEARLHTIGITGLKYVELMAGSQDSPVLPVNSRIKYSPTFLSEIDERAEVLANKVERLVENLTELTGRENSRQLNRVLSTGSNFVTTADAMLKDNRKQIDNTFRNLAATTESLAGAAEELREAMDSINGMITDGKLSSTLSDLHRTALAMRQQFEGPLPDLVANLNSMAGNIDTTFTHVDRTVLQSRKNILDAVQNLEETLLNVRQATELIREDPSILIRGRAEQ